jgi:hypothetical protein
MIAERTPPRTFRGGAARATVGALIANKAAAGKLLPSRPSNP